MALFGLFKETPEGAELRKIFSEVYADELAASEDRGEAKGVLKSFASLVKDGILNVADAAKRAGVSVEEINKAIAML